MSKFIKLDDRLINTDTIAEVYEDRVILKSGDVVRGETNKFFESLENDGRVIPVHTTTYAVMPRAASDHSNCVLLEEYPIIGWRISEGWLTSSRAKPVFHECGGEVEYGYYPFSRYSEKFGENFPLAIRFEGSDKIWQEGCAMSRHEFVELCKHFLSRSRDREAAMSKARASAQTD